MAEEASKETREDGTYLAAEAEARRLVYVALTRAKESVVRGYGYSLGLLPHVGIEHVVLNRCSLRRDFVVEKGAWG